MTYPTNTPVLTQQESIEAIIEAEAGLAQCLQDLFCNLTDKIKTLAGADLTKASQLTKTVLNTYACKESAMANLVQAIALKLWAEQGLVPDGDGGTEDTCPC